jgi:hypothetical protein
MNDSVVISEVDAVMNVVLIKAEKHVPYGEVEFITFQLRWRTNRSRNNRGQLYFWRFSYVVLPCHELLDVWRSWVRIPAPRTAVV